MRPNDRSRWLVSPAVDLLVGCGGWSLPFLAVMLALQSRHAAAFGFGFYLLGLFCNNPHYMATIQRAYGRSGDFHKYRFFTVYISALCVVTVVLAHLLPGLFPWLVTLYLTWSPWHYTGQNFGIAQMFVRRSGAAPDPTARSLLWWGYVASYAGWFLELNSHRDAGDPTFLSLDLPGALTRPLLLLCAAAFVGCTVASLWKTAAASSNRAILAPAVMTSAQLLWFVVPALASRLGGAVLPASYFSAGALAFMHCAQYLWITSYYARRETEATGGRFSFGSYYIWLIVGGIALFVPGPWIASRVLKHDFVESFLIFMSLVNLHHFILDGAIWKLKDGRVARLLLGGSPGETAQVRSRPWDPARSAGGPATGDAATREAAIQTATDIHRPRHTFLRLRPIALAGLALALLAFAALDQTQYFLTLDRGSAAALAAAERLNPSDPRVPFRKAALLVQAGDESGAARELRGLLERNPRNAPALRMLGEVLIRSGDSAGALDAYDRLAALFSQDIAVATNRGLLNEQLGRHAAAIQRFQEALRISPERLELHVLLARALRANGQARPAIAQYEQFAHTAESSASATPGGVPAYVQAALALGELHAEIGERPQAMRWLQRAADAAATDHEFPEAADALDRLASAQDAAGQSEEAAKNRRLAAQASAFGSPKH